LDARQKISDQIGIDHNVFKTWIHNLCYVRNICAHHGRLWNRNLTIRPLIPDKEPLWLDMNLNNKKLFATIATAEWIYRKIYLPLPYIENVHACMKNISALDPRFSAMMGVPTDREIGMCWEVE
jgi:abortive infection bacteriophage resistance protein